MISAEPSQLSLLIFQEGMGQLKVVAGGLQVIGEFIMDFSNCFSSQHYKAIQVALFFAYTYS